MSPGDQFLAALISSLFDIIVSVTIGAFEALIVPILQALPALLGFGGGA